MDEGHQTWMETTTKEWFDKKALKRAAGQPDSVFWLVVVLLCVLCFAIGLLI